MKKMLVFKSLHAFVFILLFATQLPGQNVGIGVINPQKGKLEIAGALGNQTTVLTIGSDGTGISLQRNWPTIGLNQYRDASNTQRFIGAGYAGSIYLSAVDGSIVFSQFGQGAANAPITTANAPFYITGDGVVNITKQLSLGSNVEITKAETGAGNNLLPYAYGRINGDGTKLSGSTANFLSYKSGDSYRIEFSEPISNAALVVTANGNNGRVTSYQLANDNTYEVFIFTNTGLVGTASFSFVVFRQ
jgi:hypothetical protein